MERGRSKKHHIIEGHKETESSYGTAKGLNQEQDKSCLPEMQRLLNSCNKYFHVNGIPHWTCVLRYCGRILLYICLELLKY